MRSEESVKRFYERIKNEPAREQPPLKVCPTCGRVEGPMLITTLSLSDLEYRQGVKDAVEWLLEMRKEEPWRKEI